MEDRDIAGNRLYAAIAYLGILFLIPLLVKKNSPFAQHHAKQGLALFFVWVVWGFVGFIFSLIPQLSRLMQLGYLAMIIVAVIGIVKAWQGKWWIIPIIGEQARKLKV